VDAKLGVGGGTDGVFETAGTGSGKRGASPGSSRQSSPS